MAKIYEEKLAQNRAWYAANKERRKAQRAVYYADRATQFREKKKEHYQQHRGAILVQKKVYHGKRGKLLKRVRARKQRTNVTFRVVQALRVRVCDALRGVAVRSDRTLLMLGCSVPQLREHLSAQFSPGMGWHNYGFGEDRWHVDHRRPCASFDLTDPAQQRACFHFSNLQPMWHTDNLRKGSKFEK